MSRSTRKICIASNTAWYAYNFRGRMIASLVSNGDEVVVVSPHDRYAEKLSLLGARHVDIRLDQAGTNPLKDARSLLHLIRLLRHERPDLLLTFTPKINIYGALAAWIARVPVVANISGLGSGFIRGGWLARVMAFLYRISLRKACRVFFQNEDDRNLFIASRLVDPRKAERLPGSGVDVDRFIPVAQPDADRPFVFLLVARLLWDKGIGEFVEAARILRREYPNVEFVVVGSADAKNITAIPAEQIERWSKEAIVRYVGSSDSVIEHYARANCVVLPSYREGTSRVLLEAASMALPLIATDVPGCREVVEDGVNGYLCRVHDAVDLADKMRWMMRINSQGREAMGAAGRRKMVEQFDERRVIARYLELVGSVAALRQHQRAGAPVESIAS